MFCIRRCNCGQNDQVSLLGHKFHWLILFEADDGPALSADEATRVLASQDAVCFVQIETKDALYCVDSIAAVPGVDVRMSGS